MTRLELLTVLVARARSHGFEFRRWYTGNLGLPWISAEAALVLLDQQRRYYALLFSHEFAFAFWQGGADITFSVPEQTYERNRRDGTRMTVTRTAFTRKSSYKTAWKHHLREMAAAEEPLRYLRRYLNLNEELVEEGTPPEPSAEPEKPSPGKRATKPAHALSTDVPGFLRRPYP